MAARVANPSHDAGQDSELRRNYGFSPKVHGVGMIRSTENVVSNDEQQRVNPAAAGTPVHGPWNPGIQSQIPRELRHLSTIFRPENVSTSMAAGPALKGLPGCAA